MGRRGILAVISGFSGAGKGTLMKKLISEYDYSLSISMTTRAPREGETDGKDYFFVSKEKFEETIAAGGFLEHACYCGNYYGTPLAYVENELAAGRDVILEIEAQGALQVKKKFPEALLIFVLTPDVDTLSARLNGRGTETAEAISKRLHRAAEEVELVGNYDSVLVNDDIDRSAEELNNMIRAAKTAVCRNIDFIEGFRGQFAELFKGGEK